MKDWRISFNHKWTINDHKSWMMRDKEFDITKDLMGRSFVILLVS